MRSVEALLVERQQLHCSCLRCISQDLPAIPAVIHHFFVVSSYSVLELVVSAVLLAKLSLTCSLSA